MIYGMKLDFKLRQKIWRAKVNKMELMEVPVF